MTIPYIDQNSRDKLDTSWVADTPGELSYEITKLIYEYVEEGLTYQLINEVLGALEGSKLEFYRRVVVPCLKIIENGDVYGNPAIEG